MFFASSNILVAVLLPLSVRRRMEEGTILVADLPVTICSARLSTVHDAWGDCRGLCATAISDAQLQGKRQSRAAMRSQPRCTIVVRDV
jgi:hypothetical protein